jgi:hypothetical protein
VETAKPGRGDRIEGFWKAASGEEASMFTVRGVTRDGRNTSIAWYPPSERHRAQGEQRGLVGDAILIQSAIIAEGRGDVVDATPTGPTLTVNLDDPEATLVLLATMFRPRCRVDGSPPPLDYPLPEGAIP